MNASTTITNKARQTPRDLAIPQTDVWALLDEEAEWRSLLEMQRPCRVRLVSLRAELPREVLSIACGDRKTTQDKTPFTRTCAQNVQ